MNDEYLGPETDGEDVAMFADLGHFQTGAIPVDATVKRGRAIRTWRRVAGGGALAIAAALAIGVPVAIAGGGSGGIASAASAGPNGTYAASSSGGRVTVNPTPFYDGKGYFSGTVDGKKWSVDFDNVHCDYSALWSCGFPDLYPRDKYASLTGDTGENQPVHYVLFLNKDVARAEITLQDGEVLSLQAVPTAKVPVVLFALPPGLGVSKVEVFDSHDAEIAYSLPFNFKGAKSAAAQWYKPGEKPPTFSGSVEIMGSHGDPEGLVSAYVGPSGPCVVTQGGGPGVSCNLFGPVTGSLDVRSPVVVSAGGAKSYGDISGAGLVAPNVARMQIDFADGTKSPVSIKSLGGYHFYAYYIPKGKEATGITAFDSSGKALPIYKDPQMTDSGQK